MATKQNPTKDRLQGMIANLPMVFQDEAWIDEQALQRNIRSYLAEGFKGLYLMGTSGEFFNVSPEEYRKAVQIFVEEGAPNVLKIVGCSSSRLGEMLRTLEWLNDSGIDCVLVIPPYLIPLNSEERTGALRRIAQACPSLGVVHYNTDYAPGVRFKAQDYRSLLDIPNFWGTKQGTLTMEFWNDLQHCAPDINHLTLDDWLVPAMRNGGRGAFSLLTSLAPRFALKWFDACQSGNWSLAEEMEQEFKRFMDSLYWPLSRRSYTDIAVDKALIDAFGFLTAGDPRPPLKPLSQEDKRWAAEKIEKENFFRKWN